MDLEYNLIGTSIKFSSFQILIFTINNIALILDVWHWSYNLKSEVISPSVFQYLIKDEHNLLKFDSYIKVNKYSLDEGHTLKIYTSDGLDDSYEFRWFIDNEKSGWKSSY